MDPTSIGNRLSLDPTPTGCDTSGPSCTPDAQNAAVGALLNDGDASNPSLPKAIKQAAAGDNTPRRYASASFRPSTRPAATPGKTSKSDDKPTSQLTGFFDGIADGAVDMCKGAWTVIGGSAELSPASLALEKASEATGIGSYRGYSKTSDALSQAVKTVATHPGAVLKAAVQPYTTAWNAGEYGKALGRGTFDAATFVIGGAGGASKLAETATFVDRAGSEAATVARVGLETSLPSEGTAAEATTAAKTPMTNIAASLSKSTKRPVNPQTNAATAFHEHPSEGALPTAQPKSTISDAPTTSPNKPTHEPGHPTPKGSANPDAATPLPPQPTDQPLLLRYTRTTHTLSQIRGMSYPSRWKAGEQYVQELYGSPGQQHFTVPPGQFDGEHIAGSGGRFVDAPVATADGGVEAHEVKTYKRWTTVDSQPTPQTVPLSSKIKQQVLKDSYLKKNEPGYRPNWIFLDAPPSQELEHYLSSKGIPYVIHH